LSLVGEPEDVKAKERKFEGRGGGGGEGGEARNDIDEISCKKKRGTSLV